MKRQILLIAVFCLCLILVVKSNDAYQLTEVELFPVIKDGKWGYMNRKGEVTIEPKFSGAGEFSDGLAAVRIGTIGRGYIDKTGKTVITFNNNEAMYHGDFHEGLAVVRYSDSQIRYIDKAGKIAIQIPFAEAFRFSEGIARVSDDGKFGYIDKNGKLITDLIFDGAEDFLSGVAKVKIGSRLGYIDKTGNYIWKPTK